MKRVANLIITSSLCVLVWGSAAGQSTEPLVGMEHEIEAARKLMRTERRLVIAGELFLTPDESKAFWPVYKEYQAEMILIGDAKVNLITEYADNVDKITPALAERLLNDNLDIESRFHKTRKGYVRKFKKVLPVIKVVRLYQIENKLDAVLNFQLASKIPLVQETGR